PRRRFVSWIVFARSPSGYITPPLPLPTANACLQSGQAIFSSSDLSASLSIGISATAPHPSRRQMMRTETRSARGALRVLPILVVPSLFVRLDRSFTDAFLRSWKKAQHCATACSLPVPWDFREGDLARRRSRQRRSGGLSEGRCCHPIEV